MLKKWSMMCWGVLFLIGLLVFPSSALAAGENILRTGDRGDAVVQLQKELKRQGFFTYKTTTGYYGKITQDAVIAFQNHHKLWPDGIAGPVTRKILLGSRYTTVSSRSGSQTYSSNSLREGSRGSEVKKLQDRLKSLGYYTYSRCTGFYGPITESAVKKFQSANSLVVDGIAGKRTLGKAYGSSAKKAGSVKSTKTTSKSKPKSSKTTTSRSASGSATASKVITLAKKYMGKPYVYGASGPKAFDCTGFTTYVYRQFGISLPRSAREQGYRNYGIKVSKNQLMPGDLVFFNTIRDGDLSDHAGIYIGGGKFIHASSSRTSGRYVRISSLNSGYYSRVFSWGRRVLR